MLQPTRHSLTERILTDVWDAERSMRLRREPAAATPAPALCLEALDSLALMAVPQGYEQQRALDAANRLRASLRAAL